MHDKIKAALSLVQWIGLALANIAMLESTAWAPVALLLLMLAALALGVRWRIHRKTAVGLPIGHPFRLVRKSPVQHQG